ncbi:MAG TPA: winged helix-turn-helix domain-containing protein [Nitrososphaeraceae archaeon]|nr:winged helix-turn-helix domain-containing protein [Nitrososphaeraceae archaeon]
MIKNTTRYRKRTYLIHEKIIQYINDSPGIRYRELLKINDLSSSSLSYHLKLLIDSKRINVYRSNDRVTRFFSPDVSISYYNLIGLLRQYTCRKIVLYILKYEPCRFKDIVKYIHKAPSTIAWHLSRLIDTNIIKMYIQNDIKYYKIKINKPKLRNLL